MGQDLKGKVDCGPAGSSGRHTANEKELPEELKVEPPSQYFLGEAGPWKDVVVVVYLDYTCTFKNQDLTLVIFGGLLQIVLIFFLFSLALLKKKIIVTFKNVLI